MRGNRAKGVGVMKQDELMTLARIGAKAEAQRLLDWLKTDVMGTPVEEQITVIKVKGKRPPMSDAQRKAIGRRVKAAWKRRKAGK
jgi:hypothetical protein